MKMEKWHLFILLKKLLAKIFLDRRTCSHVFKTFTSDIQKTHHQKSRRRVREERKMLHSRAKGNKNLTSYLILFYGSLMNSSCQEDMQILMPYCLMPGRWNSLFLFTILNWYKRAHKALKALAKIQDKFWKRVPQNYCKFWISMTRK